MKKSTKDKVSAKIAKVKRDDPSLTNAQAAGKAYGILRSQGTNIPKRKKTKIRMSS